jgi:hypothetical protein
MVCAIGDEQETAAVRDTGGLVAGSRLYRLRRFSTKSVGARWQADRLRKVSKK